MDVIKFTKEKIASLVRQETAEVRKARTTVLRLLKEDRINEEEAHQLLNGLDTVNIKELNFTVDNHVETNATHWGNIATGNSSVNDYFEKDRK